MNISSKSIAVAVAGALGASAAHALPPTATINYTFYEGGGSEQENTVFSAIYRLLVHSSIDVYSDNGSSPSESYLVVTGTTNPNVVGTTLAPFNSGGANIMFIYRFDDANIEDGVYPLAYSTSASQAKLSYPTIASISSATSTGAATPLPSSPTYSYPYSNGNNEVTDFGVTGAEVSLFNYFYNLNGYTVLTSSQLSNISSDGLYDDVYGIAVTNTVYNGTSGFPHAKTSLTRPEIAGILTGTTQNWNQMFADDGTQMPNKPLWFLDRGSGSATKTGENQYFLNYPGGSNYGASFKPESVRASANSNYTDTILSLSGGYQDVWESSMPACVRDLQTANGAGDYAIAVLSAQAPPAFNQVANTNVYSFVKIDGVGIDAGTGSNNINGTTATSYTNVVTGAYDFVLQNSFNYRAGFLTASPQPPAGSPPNVVMAYEMRYMLQANSISGANNGYSFPLAVTGVLIDPVLAPTQDAGVILDSRYRDSASPMMPNFDATDSGASGTGGVITYGSSSL